MHNLHLFITWATDYENAVQRTKDYFNHYAVSGGVDYFTPFKVRKQGSDKVITINDYAASRYSLDLNDEALKQEYKNFFENTSLKHFLYLIDDERLARYSKFAKTVVKLISVESSLKDFVEFIKNDDLEYELFKIMRAVEKLDGLCDVNIIKNNYDIWVSEYASNKITTPLGLTNDTIWEEIENDIVDKYLVAIDVHA